MIICIASVQLGLAVASGQPRPEAAEAGMVQRVQNYLRKTTGRLDCNMQLQSCVNGTVHAIANLLYVLVSLSGPGCASLQAACSVLLRKSAGRADAAVVSGGPVAEAAEVLVAVHIGRPATRINSGVCRLVVVELHELCLRGVRLRAL
jgi:hypothetical protein